MAITPTPWPYKTEYERMVHELINMHLRLREDPEQVINTSDDFCSRLSRLGMHVRGGRPMTTDDEVFVQKLYDRLSKFLRDTERVKNPPEGHPSYIWPEGVKYRPMEEFLPGRDG